MQKLYVRVAPKSCLSTFYRCAILFTLAWSLVEVDEATASRLHAEQVLEVTGEEPADYVEPEVAAAQLVADEAAAALAEDEAAAEAQALGERKAAIESAEADLAERLTKQGEAEADLAERATALSTAENGLAEREAKLAADEQALAERITAQAVAAEAAKTASKPKAK